ncbi:hypothetical protein [Amycolatopsis sp. NPDC059021]|uniref:hypothetical protein n=1 Tax=Amycolatopsis sp. NPDC059021 TaxID=3346704 RepID=UPI0036708BA3
MENDGNSAAQAQQDEKTAERWVFGGSHVDQGKPAHAWLDPNGAHRVYKTRGSYTVGAIYAAAVTRDGDRVTLYGTPKYLGDFCDDTALVDQLAARHRAAEAAPSLAAHERAAKQKDPLERAIDRLTELAAHIAPAQRTGFAAYVLTRLMRGRR